MVRFLVIGDLHGIMPRIQVKEFDAIICPGDICGDDMRPYIKEWIKKRTKLKTDTTLNFDQFCSPKKQKELNIISLKKGRKVLEYLNQFGKPVFIVPGNWDPTHYQDGIKDTEVKKHIKKDMWLFLSKGLKNIIDIENKKATFKDMVLVGHGSTSAPEPIYKIPRAKFNSDAEYRKYLFRNDYFTKIFEKLSNYMKGEKRPVILLTHNVPYSTKLDLVNAPGTYAHGKHYGSIIARKLIDKYRPVLCVGGHIHEGYGKFKVDNTVCINAGFGGDVNTIVDIRNGKVTKLEFLGKNKIE